MRSPAPPDEDEALLTDDILQKLAEEPALDEALRRWWERWRLGPEQGLLVVERLRRAGGDLARAALGLHATIRDAVRSVSKRPMVGPVDVSFAEHQLEVGDVEGARALMESLVAELPAADVLDVVSRDDDDQAAIRERLLELLSQVRGTEAAPDVPTLVELAHLAPFDRERVAALARHGAPGLAERARTVGALLAPGGLAPSDERAGGEAGARSPAPPLAEADIEDGLRHPATRRRGVVERLQTLIAEVDVPDHGALQDYCERLSPRSETHAVVADVCVTLGAPAVTTFVSRGERSVGVRVYEGSPPFLIIGGEHLDPASSQLLSPSELRFAVGAEILHLRLGHARITSSEVWAGALETGKTTLDVVFSVLPAFKIAKWAERVQSVAAHVPERAVGRLLGQTTKWLGSRRRPESSGAVDAGTEALIEAHRMMQLSADRAGLVLGGDLAGAVRAMFKLRPVYHAELSVAERIGLGEALARRHPTGERRLPDLAIRVGALIGFYLTEDYARLRAMVEARAS
jgi:hypothetical protein